MMLEPLTGRCHVQVTKQRTKKDWVQVMKDLVDRYYPEAERLTVVMDNLSSHQKAQVQAWLPTGEEGRKGQMAIYHRRCTHQAASPLSSNTTELNH